MTDATVPDGPINRASFPACVQQVLAPTLEPGDVVIMDRFATHESTPVRNAITRIIQIYSPRECANKLAAAGCHAD